MSRYHISPLTLEEVQNQDDRSDQILREINQLLRVLSTQAEPVSLEYLGWILKRGSTIFVARTSGGEIVGMSTYVPMAQPVKGKAWLEDVAVLGAHQGNGLGKALVTAVSLIAARDGVTKLNLTSGRSRGAAAVALYTKLGWQQRDSILMRQNPQTLDLASIDTSIISLPDSKNTDAASKA